MFTLESTETCSNRIFFLPLWKETLCFVICSFCRKIWNIMGILWRFRTYVDISVCVSLSVLTISWRIVSVIFSHDRWMTRQRNDGWSYGNCVETALIVRIVTQCNTNSVTFYSSCLTNPHSPLVSVCGLEPNLLRTVYNFHSFTFL